jgi:hypothetical protein
VTGHRRKEKFKVIDEKVTTSDVNLKSLELLGEYRDLAAKNEKYQQHLEQVKTCRTYVRDLKENVRLNPKLALMYRDFVSWYSASGEKIIDLVFVLYRSVDGRLVRTTIHNIYWGEEAGQTCAFYRDALLHLLSTSLLRGITHLYISGDHGPAFSGKETVFFESTVYSITVEFLHRDCVGLELEAVYLASYHCFNECDGAGASAKSMYLRYWFSHGIVAEQTESTKGQHLVDMLNGGGLSEKGSPDVGAAQHVVAYYFGTIDQGDLVFEGHNGAKGLPKNRNVVERLRDRCQIKYR